MHIAHLGESFFRCPSKTYRPFINTQFLAQVSHSTGTFPSRAEVLKCQGPWENHGNDWNYLRTGGVGARSILGGSHHHQKGGGGWKRQSFLTEYKKGGDAIESWLPWGGGGRKSFEYYRALRGKSGKFHCDTTKILRPLSAIVVLSPFVDCPQEPFKLGGCSVWYISLSTLGKQRQQTVLKICRFLENARSANDIITSKVGWNAPMK